MIERGITQRKPRKKKTQQYVFKVETLAQCMEGNVVIGKWQKILALTPHSWMCPKIIKVQP